MPNTDDDEADPGVPGADDLKSDAAAFGIGGGSATAEAEPLPDESGDEPVEPDDRDERSASTEPSESDGSTGSDQSSGTAEPVGAGEPVEPATRVETDEPLETDEPRGGSGLRRETSSDDGSDGVGAGGGADGGTGGGGTPGEESARRRSSTSIREEMTEHAVFLPEETSTAIKLLYKQLDVEHERRKGEELQLNRGFWSAAAEVVLENEDDIREKLGLE